MFILLAALSFGFVSDVQAQVLVTRELEVDADLKLRIGVMSPGHQAPVADVIYLHGFADRLDHHHFLFRELASHGFRVISFDYPSHGETHSHSLDCYSVFELTEITKMVERSTREANERPLFVVAWSTGGLLAVRMAQMNIFGRWDRKPQGLVLHAPLVSFQILSGHWRKVTRESLTNNKEAYYLSPPKPSSLYLKPIYSARLFFHSFIAGLDSLPPDLPILTIVAGSRSDEYADSEGLINWVMDQRKKLGDRNDQLVALQCPEAKHELDNEAAPIGETVRVHTRAFLESILRLDANSPHQTSQLPGCVPF